MMLNYIIRYLERMLIKFIQNYMNMIKIHIHYSNGLFVELI